MNVRDFGAPGDGLSHPLSERYKTLSEAQAVYPHAESLDDEIDWAAIQAAIKVARAGRGGTVWFPRGTYICSKPLNLDNTQNTRLEGSGQETVIKHSRAGPSFISARSSSLFSIRGLNVISRSATVVDLSQSASPTATNSAGAGQALIETSLFVDESGVGTVDAFLSLDKAISCTIRNNYFYGAQVAIRGIDTGSDPPHYSNANLILNNTFQALTKAAITNAGDAWLIQGNTFECLAPLDATGSGTAAAYVAYIDDPKGVSPPHHVSFIGNWFGDANENGTWINWWGRDLIVLGNFFEGGHAAVGLGRLPASSYAGVSIIGNYFVTNIPVDFGQDAPGQANVVILGNGYDDISTPVAGMAPTGTIYHTGVGTVGIGPGTSTGAPKTGAHQLGELYVDSAGVLWICTLNGTPGTWVKVASQA